MVRPRSTRRTRRPTRGAVLRGARGYTRSRGVYGRFLPSSRTELKVFDMVARLANTSTNFNTTGQVVSILGTTALGIARGTALNERIANRVTVKSIQLNFVITGVAGSQTYVGQQALIYLVLDNQPNGALPNPVELVATHESAGGAATLPANVASSGDFRNVVFTRRFTVLAKARYMPTGVFATDGAATPATQLPVCGPKNYSIYKKCNIPVEYTSTGATNSGFTAEVMKNNILLFMFAGGVLMQMSYSSRVRYADQ